MNPISFKITTQSKAPPKTRPQQLFSNDDEIVTESTKPRIDPKAEGVAFAGKGQFQKALSSFSAGLLISPNDYELYEMQAQVLLEIGETFKAIKVAERCVSLAPTYAFGFLTLGRAQLNLGEPEMAVEALKQAKTLSPENEEIAEEYQRSLQIMVQRREISLARINSQDKEEKEEEATHKMDIE